MNTKLFAGAVGIALMTSPLFAASAQAADYCAAGKPIKFAGIEWKSGSFITKTIATILQNGYGCQTEEVTGTSIILTKALTTNDVQVYAEQWVGRTAVYDQAVAAGLARNVGHPFTGATEGWFVPTYMIKGDAARGIEAAAPGLKGVDQLADPKIAQLFSDPEEPTKGRFVNCPPGWSCDNVNTAKLSGYGLADKYTDFHPGSGAALDASVTAAYLRGEAVLFYYWSPTALLGKMDLTQLQEPSYSDDCWKELKDASKKPAHACAYPSPEVVYGVNAEFAAAAPEIVEILGKATIPVEVLNKSLAYMADNKVDTDAASREFLKTRTDVWGGWVSEEAKAKILAALK